MEKKVFTKKDRPEKIDGEFSIPYGYTGIGNSHHGCLVIYSNIISTVNA